MKKRKAAIIGVGGRTGTMFAFELAETNDVLGIGRKREVEMIKERKLYVERKKEAPKIFKDKVIIDSDFQKEETPDIIFLTVKNPISPAVRYYFQRLKDRGRLPTLLISQNGISAISDAKKALYEIFGKNSERIRLVRIILFNPIDLKKIGDKFYIKYALPARISLAKVSGPGDINDITNIFEKAGFQIKVFPQKEVKNLEYSKLFLNLIGMASASRGLSVKEGFKSREIFKEEIRSLKEYIKAVKLSGGKFINISDYPVKFLAALFCFAPSILLLPLRNTLAQVVGSRREEKPKVLDEIDYYNGAVVRLGKGLGLETPINERICQRALAILKKD